MQLFYNPKYQFTTVLRYNTKLQVILNLKFQIKVENLPESNQLTRSKSSSTNSCNQQT
jgi:hypothetical protein